MSSKGPFYTLVRENVQEEYKQFNLLNRTDYSDTSIFEILHDKVNGRPMRAIFAFTMYKFLKSEGGDEGVIPITFFERQLPFIVEAIISVQYYHNQVLDGKGGVTSAAAINRNLVLGNLFKDQLYRYLDTVALDSVTKLKLINCVRSIFEYTDIGQHIEKHCNTYEAYCNHTFDHPFQNRVDQLIEPTLLEEVEQIVLGEFTLEEEYLPFLRIYLQRIYLINVPLFKLFTNLLIELLNLSPQERKETVRFAILFGWMDQIVNDCCDFAKGKTVSKTCKDVYSDLKNGNITLPLIIHMQLCPDGKITQFLENRALDIEEDLFFKEITDYWSIYYAMTIGKGIYKRIKFGLSIVPEKWSEILIDLCSKATNNKYYRYYYDQDSYGDYRGR